MTNKQEPLEVKAYQCPYQELGCNYLILDQEEAERHSNIPIDRPLPTGLVYVARRLEPENKRLRRVNHYEIVLGVGKFENGNSGTNLEHSYTQPVACFSYLGRPIDEGVINSRIFRQVISRGSESYDEDFGLLTEKELERANNFPFCFPKSIGWKNIEDVFQVVYWPDEIHDRIQGERK